MRRLESILGTVALVGALSSLPAAAQVIALPASGPVDGMTAGGEDLIVPACVRGAGQYGAFFATDIWIKAAGTGTATLYYHAVDSATSAPTATATVHLAQPMTYLRDVIATTFGLPSAFGAVRISTGFPISATVRVYNQSGNGAYGLGLPGMPARTAMGSMPTSGNRTGDEFSMYMVGLLPEPGNRVNVNVVSTSSKGASGVVEIVDADGLPPAGPGAKSLPFALAGYSSHQFNDVLLDLYSKLSTGGAALQVRVRMNQGVAGTVMAYAVVNDNLTNDGYLVMGTMMNGGMGMGSGMTGAPAGE